MERPNHSSFKVSPGGDCHVLALAALFGGDFSIDWIVELTGKKASQVLAELGEGIREGSLTQKELGIFSFASLRERKRWQGHLTPLDRERRRRQIADLLINEHPDDENKAQAIAPYLFDISNNVEGCRWLKKAGDHFLKNLDLERALPFYNKILEDLANRKEEGAEELFMETVINYSKISMITEHDTSRMLSLLQEALVKAQKIGKIEYEAIVEMHLAKNEWFRSQYESALSHFERGWAIAQEIGNPKLLRSAITFRTFFLYWQGRLKEVIQLYEKSVSDVEKFPQGGFPIMAAFLVGYCYAQTGQTTQGLGMLDALCRSLPERTSKPLIAEAEVTMAIILIDIRRIQDALLKLHAVIDKCKKEQNPWCGIRARLMLAFAHYLSGKNEEALTFLEEFTRQSEKVQITVKPHPYLLELCWAMEEGKIPYAPNISLRKELNRSLDSQNIYMKGVAYRYLAFLQRREGAPNEKVIDSLKLSLKWLEESGHQIEQARSQLELGRFYLQIGKKEEGEKLTQNAANILSSVSEALIPDDLRNLFNGPKKGESLLKEILKLGQEMATIRDKKELFQHIISTVNRITGAERGAIFLWDENRNPKILLRASKNLTSAEVNHPNFASSLKIIEHVALTGQSQILEMEGREETSSGKDICSCLCVPMFLIDKVVGILYHDNRLIRSSFRESDLEILSYFAAQAAIALDNVQAYERVQQLNQRLWEEKRYYEEENLQSLHFEEIVGESRAIKKMLGQIEQVALTDTTVLILGETGVGKELVARAIHRHSKRRGKPFIKVLCSALPESLIPSELFGHEKGAFTGAVQRRIGRFELADGGTFFLDEIGELSLDIQVRLLRVLQNKEFERVGGSETLKSDFRLIVATNRDLQEQIRVQKFRTDFFYRLNVFPIRVPPLRERKEDIPLLAHFFLKNYATKMGKSLEGIPKVDIEKLMQYDWPGNVRELENIIERGAILSVSSHFRIPELFVPTRELSSSKNEFTLRDVERRHISLALEMTRWKVRGPGGAAELLDIHPSTLAFRMKKLGIQRPPKFSPRKTAHSESSSKDSENPLAGEGRTYRSSRWGPPVSTS